MLLYNAEPGIVKPEAQENCTLSSSGFGFELLPDMQSRTKRFVWDETLERFAA